jgi:hypothetical protein
MTSSDGMGAKITLRDRDLVGLKPRELDRRLRELAHGATGIADGEVHELDAAIVALEQRLARSAAEVRDALDDGTLEETPDILRLLMLARQRDLLTGR